MFKSDKEIIEQRINRLNCLIADLEVQLSYAIRPENIQTGWNAVEPSRLAWRITLLKEERDIEQSELGWLREQESKREQKLQAALEEGV